MKAHERRSRTAPRLGLFRDGAPGATPVQVMARADNVWRRVRSHRHVLLFSSGHFHTSVGGGWIGLEHRASSLLLASDLSAVGYDHSLARPVIGYGTTRIT